MKFPLLGEKEPPLYIFDLDGTLADCRHRLHILENRDLYPNSTDRWKVFHRACTRDPVIPSVFSIFKMLLQQENTEVVILTGRSSVACMETCAWFHRVNFPNGFQPKNLFMRKQGDCRDAVDFKYHFYRNVMGRRDRQRLVTVFEDEQRLVNMWRDLGVECLQPVIPEEKKADDR